MIWLIMAKNMSHMTLEDNGKRRIKIRLPKSHNQLFSIVDELMLGYKRVTLIFLARKVSKASELDYNIFYCNLDMSKLASRLITKFLTRFHKQ